MLHENSQRNGALLVSGGTTIWGERVEGKAKTVKWEVEMHRTYRTEILRIMKEMKCTRRRNDFLFLPQRGQNVRKRKTGKKKQKNFLVI